MAAWCIHTNKVLECLPPYSTSAAQSYLVRAGSDFWRYDGQVSTVDSINVHDRYDKKNTSNYDFNVAVLKLAKPLDLKHARPVRLVDVGAVAKEGQSLTVLGWGFSKVHAAATTPQDLRGATMTTVDTAKCQKQYRAVGRATGAGSFCAVGESCEVRRCATHMRGKQHSLSASSPSRDAC